MDYLDTFVANQSTARTIFHLPLEQYLNSKKELDSRILQPLWFCLTQLLEHCIGQPPSEDIISQKAVLCCETVISWDFGVEEGTFRRVSFGPTTAAKPESDEDEDETQPIWPGSWGNAINDYVIDLFFKVDLFGAIMN
jgi:hypothetical protein